MYKHLSPTFDKHIPHCPGEREQVWLGVRGAERLAGCRQWSEKLVKPSYVSSLTLSIPSRKVHFIYM